MASTTDVTRDGLLRAEYGVENDTYYYLGTQLVARKRSGLRPDLIFLSGFEALLPRALAKRLVEALVGLKSGGESVTWFLTDHLGSNIATVDAAGAVIERSQFAPYGERWGKVAERGPGFTGHYEDQSTLTYMKARYYGGIVGRFLSPDPVLTDTADGRNFNRYWYANNNLQKFVDPDGRLSEMAADRWADTVAANPEVFEPIAPYAAAAALLIGGAPFLAASGSGTFAGIVFFGRTGLKIRSDILLHGGRAGSKVENLVGPPNSAMRGGNGRVFVTNGKGQVIKDITKDRVKDVNPGKGFGDKRVPSSEELKLIDRVWQ